MRDNTILSITFLGVFIVACFAYFIGLEYYLSIMVMGIMSSVFCYNFNNFGEMGRLSSFKDKISTIMFYVIWIFMLLFIYYINNHQTPFFLISICGFGIGVLFYSYEWIKKSSNSPRTIRERIQVPNIDRNNIPPLPVSSVPEKEDIKVVKKKDIKDRLNAI